MSNALLSSKVIITEAPPQIISVPALPTAVAAMIGVTERGPVGERTLSTSFEEWRQVYGGATAESLDSFAAVQGFFEEGGQFLWFTRTVHYTDITDESTKTSAAATDTAQTASTAPTAGTILGSLAEPFDLEPGDTLLVAVDGGGADTVTFDAAAASFTGTNTETFALSDGQTLTIDIDNLGVQTVTFNTAEFADIGNATAAEVAAVMNAEMTGVSVDTTGGAVRLTTDKRGTDAEIDITGGTAAATLGMTVGVTNGTGDVADIDAVTAAEAAALILADVTGVTTAVESGAVRITSSTTGASSSVQVEAASTADDELGFDNATHSGIDGTPQDTLDVTGKYDGAYGNDVSVQFKAATNGEAARFDLDVLVSGAVAESFQNLTMDDDDDNYVETVVNADGIGSLYITVSDLDLGLGAENDRPANATLSLSGGDDGLSGIADSDFIGSDAASPKTGIRSLDDIPAGQPRPTLLGIPSRPTAAVHNAMITYCEITQGKSCMAILDSPAAQTASSVITYFATTAAVVGLSEFGAAYWPHVKVLNPNKTLLGDTDTVTVPPSGHIMGMMARNDASRPGGVYVQPAGPAFGTLRTIVGFETDEVHDVNKRDIVFPNRINILDQEGGVRNVDGARTLKGTGNFPSVGERRGVIFIEQSIKALNEVARHQNNTPELRARLQRSVEAFLINQMNVGAFRSKDPATAFFVDYDVAGTGLNVPSVVFAGQLKARIGLATNKPAEFIVLEFTQDTRALEQQLNA